LEYSCLLSWVVSINKNLRINAGTWTNIAIPQNMKANSKRTTRVVEGGSRRRKSK
jgi:hypothetical protein